MVSKDTATPAVPSEKSLSKMAAENCNQRAVVDAEEKPATRCGLSCLFYAVRSLLTAPANCGQRPSQILARDFAVDMASSTMFAPLRLHIA